MKGRPAAHVAREVPEVAKFAVFVGGLVEGVEDEDDVSAAEIVDELKKQAGLVGAELGHDQAAGFDLLVGGGGAIEESFGEFGDGAGGVDEGDESEEGLARAGEDLEPLFFVLLPKNAALLEERGGGDPGAIEILEGVEQMIFGG